MDRRMFLSSAGAASAALAFPTILTPRKSSAQNGLVYPNQFNWCGDVHANTSSNVKYNRVVPQDFTNMAASLQSVLTVWQAHNLSTVLRPGFNSVTEPMLNVAHIRDVNAILRGVRKYNPSYALSDITTPMTRAFGNTVVNGIDYKTQVLQTIRTPNGFEYYIAQAIKQANISAQQWRPNTTALANMPPSYPGPRTPTPYFGQPPIGWGGEQACGWDSIGVLGLGIAVLVLTIMTDGLDLLAAGIWAGIIYWAGQAAAVWSILHAIICGL